MKKGDLTTGTEEIQKKITTSYYKRQYSTKLGNLDEMDDFLDRYYVPKLNQDQINYLEYRWISINYEYQCKNNQQNSSKLNSRTHQNHHLPQSSRLHPRDAEMVQ